MPENRVHSHREVTTLQLKLTLRLALQQLKTKMVSAVDYRYIATKVNSRLRIKIPESEIHSLFEELELGVPRTSDFVTVQRYIADDRERLIKEAFAHIVKVCHGPPTSHELAAITASFDFTISRSVKARLVAMLKETPADGWGQRQPRSRKSKVALAPGELAVVDAIADTYGLQKNNVMSVLGTVAVIGGGMYIPFTHGTPSCSAQSIIISYH